MTSHPGVWTSHTGQAGCVQLVLAPHIILTHELCAHLLAKIVPTLSKWTEKRLGFSLILKLYCVMVNRILIQFLQRFVFSLHFSCARKNLCYQGNRWHALCFCTLVVLNSPVLKMYHSYWVLNKDCCCCCCCCCF